MDKTKKLSKTSKRIDGEKVRKYISLNKINQAKTCRNSGLNSRYISDSAKRNWANIGCWRLICQELGVPENFFDLHDPEPVKETDTGEEDSIISMADIPVTLMKIEALLLEQNKLLKEYLYCSTPYITAPETIYKNLIH